jgi:hypothetical protein
VKLPSAAKVRCWAAQAMARDGRVADRDVATALACPESYVRRILDRGTGAGRPNLSGYGTVRLPAQVMDILRDQRFGDEPLAETAARLIRQWNHDAPPNRQPIGLDGRRDPDGDPFR